MVISAGVKFRNKKSRYGIPAYTGPFRALGMYRVTRVKRNLYLGWGIFKIESKKTRVIRFLKFGNTVEIGNLSKHCLIIT
jgi:hypothetical protein